MWLLCPCTIVMEEPQEAQPLLSGGPSAPHATVPPRKSLRSAYVWTLLLCLVALIVAITTWQLLKPSSPDDKDSLDIHLEVSDPVLAAVKKFNADAKAKDPDEQIDFTTIDLPHITLYLTEFWHCDSTEIRDAVSGVVSKGLSKGCLVKMGANITVSGQYAMWPVQNSDCLQELSDAIVNATSMFRNMDAAVPPWVYDIKNVTERNEKIAYCQKYGSPNVFRQFQPHITVAASLNATRLAEAFSSVVVPDNMQFNMSALGIASTGPFGTVLTATEQVLPFPT